MNGWTFMLWITFIRACFWVLVAYVEPRKADQNSIQRHRQVLILSALFETLVWWILHHYVGWDKGQLSKEVVLEFVESYALYRTIASVQTRWIGRPISALRRYLMSHGSIVERNGSWYRLECMKGCLTGRAIPEYIKNGNTSPTGWHLYDEMASLGWDRYVAKGIRDYFDERHLAHGYSRDQIEIMVKFVDRRNAEEDEVHPAFDFTDNMFRI